MNTSQRNPSRDAKAAKRTALRRLFWQHNLMARFRRGSPDCWHVQLRHTASPVEFARWVFDENPMDIPAQDDVFFFLDPLTIGDEAWAAVTARWNDEEPIRVIEPFLVPDGLMENVPLFKEEC
jgi:hypothetical protein